LKLDFSHAKGLWHHKYRSQDIKEKKKRLKRNTKNGETQKKITKNLKKLKIKKDI